MSKIGIAVVGFGYWGPNLVRNFRASPEFDVRFIVESKPNAQANARTRFPEVETSADYDAVLADDGVHAVAIATPTATHFPLAKAALEAGKHVLIEKPITSSAHEAQVLIAMAAERGLTLMVDHTFIYTSAVNLIREKIKSDELGELYYYDSTRINLGLFQADVNVLWDLAVHDVSILMYLIDKKPTKVSAHGIAHVNGHPENTAYMSLFYSDDFIAHINVNWLSPIKTRQTLIGGEKKMIVFNDLEPTEKVKIYENGINLNVDEETSDKLKIGYRLGDIHVPHLETTEALAVMAGHFASSIKEKSEPKTSGQMGLEIVEVLEAATQSMQRSGEPIEVGGVN
ncbi:MAG: Gfo/Idh/MocA family oxidoreductase [Pseudomonadota bacterium]